MTLSERFGIYGLDPRNEIAMLASLYLGEPALLVGPPGVAKTELLKVIGQALREKSRNDKAEKEFSYQIYDTSKLNFEDLLGLPSIQAMKDNRVEFIQTPNTIWGKELVVFDELNRCEKQRQANLFEILRSRKCNGMPTGNQFIFATMNPFGDTGTEEMSDALVDRFTFYLSFDMFHDMAREDRQNVIGRIGDVEALGMRYWASDPEETNFEYDVVSDEINQTLVDAGELITTMMIKAHANYKLVEEAHGETITQILNFLVEQAGQFDTKSNDLRISGRRAAMLKRAITAYRAVELARSDAIGVDPRPIQSSVVNAIKLAIPVGIARGASEDDKTQFMHFVDTKVLNKWDIVSNNQGDKEYLEALMEVQSSSNPYRKLRILLEYRDNLEDLLATAAWSEIISYGEPNYNEDVASFVYNLHSIGVKLPDNVDVSNIQPQNDSIVNDNAQDFEIELNEHLEPHEPAIAALVTTYGPGGACEDSIIYRALKGAIAYSNVNVTNATKAIEAIHDIQKLTNICYGEIKTIKNKNIK